MLKLQKHKLLSPQLPKRRTNKRQRPLKHPRVPEVSVVARRTKRSRVPVLRHRLMRLPRVKVMLRLKSKSRKLQRKERKSMLTNSKRST